MPTQRCSEALVAYDKTWNSWVHYAVEYPQFEQECDVFMRDFQRGGLLDSVDPLWLAVYFAILSVRGLTYTTSVLAKMILHRPLY